MVDNRRVEDKALIKEALKEWLDEKYADFGRWAFRRLMALCFGAAVLYLVSHGKLTEILK